MSLDFSKPYGRPKTTKDVHNTKKPNQCAGCPLLAKGYGFVSGTYQNTPITIIDESNNAIPNPKVNLADAQLFAIGEAPAVHEVDRNQPFCGEAGNIFKGWILKNADINFDSIVVDNVLRCGQKDNKLPDKKVLKTAVAHCRQYDRTRDFQPSRFVFTLHPSAILRDVVPLPLVIHDWCRAKQMGKCIILMGKTATQKYFKFVSSIRSWRGNYEPIDEQDYDNQL